MDSPTETTRKLSIDSSIVKDDIEVGIKSSNSDDGTTKHGDLQRLLKPRQVQMIAVGGIIGSGFFIGSGAALSTGGPVGLLLGYSIMGLVTYSTIVCLGEMAALFPVAGGFVYLANRFVDPALGFALGFNYCYGLAVTIPAEITAGAIVISYWTTSVNVGVWISMFLVVIVGTNMVGVKFYEFWMSMIKIITIVGLLLLLMIIDLGGGPSGDRLGFRYWMDPGPFAQLYDIPGNFGQFCAFWSTFVNAAFSYGGVEVIALTAAESVNPHVTIPRAVRTVFWRILIFYAGGMFVIGLTVPYDTPDLLDASGTGAASPFVIAVSLAGINVLPSIINTVILLSTFSSSNSYLYASSRTLYGLAVDGQAPKILAKCTKNGLPIFSVMTISIFGLLAFMNLSNDGAVVFAWFYTLSAITCLLAWVAILVTYLRFNAGIKYHGINRNNFPYKAPFQPYLTWFGLFFTIMIVMFNGFTIFLEANAPFDISYFIASYCAIPVFIALVLFWKFYSKTTFVTLANMDFSGYQTACESAQTDFTEIKVQKANRTIGERAKSVVTSLWE